MFLDVSEGDRKKIEKARYRNGWCSLCNLGSSSNCGRLQHRGQIALALVESLLPQDSPPRIPGVVPNPPHLPADVCTPPRSSITSMAGKTRIGDADEGLKIR
jgi:hypothetical protein